MITCPPDGVSSSRASGEGAERKHHGAENSPLKKRAPSSLTARRTSERTSMELTWSPKGVFDVRSDYELPCSIAYSGVSAKKMGLSIKRKVPRLSIVSLAQDDFGEGKYGGT